MSQQHILVLDTETTGVVPPIYIVELAWCEIDEELEILNEFSTLVNPGVPMPCPASGVNGIRDEDLVDAPAIETIDFPKGEVIMIAHNARFDLKLLERYMNITGYICTMDLARKLLPDAPDYKLATLSCYCGLPRQLNHRALSDVRDCFGLLEFLMRETGWNLQQIYDYANQVERLKIMPFGKHKGLPVEMVPFGYIEWLLKGDGDISPDLRYTIKQIWGI